MTVPRRPALLWTMPASGDHSAGLLLFRHGRQHDPEVLIGHMGGPFWSRKDSSAWSIPKGLIEPGETPLEAALREFDEEIGQPAPHADYVLLGDFVYLSGKVVTVFTGEGELDVTQVTSLPVTVEWPRESGRMITFPEVDRAEWCSIDVARARLVKGQVAALAELEATLR